MTRRLSQWRLKKRLNRRNRVTTRAVRARVHTIRKSRRLFRKQPVDAGMGKCVVELDAQQRRVRCERSCLLISPIMVR